MTWALISFAAWYLDSGNLTSTMVGRFVAVQYFDYMEAGVEIDTSSPVNKWALRAIARSHAEAGTRRRVHLPVMLCMLLTAKVWLVRGKVVRMWLTAMYFFLLWSVEMFAADDGVLHPAHCLRRRNVTFSLETRSWTLCSGGTDSVEVLFRGRMKFVQYREPICRTTKAT